MSGFKQIRTRYGVTVTVEDGDEEIRLALTDPQTRVGIEAYLAPDEIHQLVEALVGDSFAAGEKQQRSEP